MADIATRVCLVTTGQPACNPRLVKEADALIDAGFDVHVVAAYPRIGRPTRTASWPARAAGRKPSSTGG